MNKLLISAILLIVSIGLTATFTRMSFNDYREKKQELKSYDAALNQAAELGVLRDGLLEKYNRLPESDRDRLERLLPRNMDTVRLTIEMTNIAKANGVSIDSFSFSENTSESSSGNDFAADPGLIDPTMDPVGMGDVANPGQINSIQVQANYSLVDMSLDVSGDYEAFKNFVANLEDNLRLTDIRSVSISSGEEDNTYNVVLRTYWLGT